MTMAFPTLFPDSTGDFYQAWLCKVYLGEYFKHLLHFQGGWFTQHKRFLWFAFNALQQARTRSQLKVFVKQQHDAGQLTAADIRAMLAEGNQHIVNQMIHYGENLWGTCAYWTAHLHELMDFIQQKGTLDIFWTLSVADLQWPDLHQHMPQTENPTEAPKVVCQRRQVLLNKNPHIAAYLDQLLQVYFKHFLSPLLGICHFWYHYEWQERGSCHIHGFFWLHNGPRANEIDWEVLKRADAIISDEQTVKMKNLYWNQIVLTSSPFPCQDKNMPLLGEHPCSLKWDTLKKHKTGVSRPFKLDRATH